MTIKAMKQALKAFEVSTTYFAKDRQEVLRSIQSLRSAIAEAEKQEPVAWMTHHDEPMLFPTVSEASEYCYDDEKPIPLFMHPTQPKRLTDEEIDRIGIFGPWPTVVFADGACGIGLDVTCARDFARAIEAKIMGEKK